jgi:Xaa-Pro dipeptidase
MSNSERCVAKVARRAIEPIRIEERESRIYQARQYMEEEGLDAIVLEPGSNLYYFTGVRWQQTDRVMLSIIPARAEVGYVCPRFEEPRLREKLTLGDDVRVWEEHQSPYTEVAGFLQHRGINRGVIGVEGALRFFVFDGISRALPHARLSSADRVTVRCRSVKSASEIDLLQHSADLTVVAFEECLRTLREGMLQEEFTENSISVYRRLGVEGSIDIQFGLATSLPHGSEHPTRLKAGDVVLMDGGCAVEGYHSDMTRTVVLGEPSKRQREIWLLEQAAQAAAFAAARPGIPIQDVDAAARRVIVEAGLGPDYETPGLPHRTGHGIGLDIHEAPYVVEGNRTELAPGMCFSNEPMIVIPGEFGIRLEDCLFMSQREACYFTEPSISIDMPLPRRNANGKALE